MINGFTWLLVAQLLGEVVVRVLDLPVPGAVVGMLILLLGLLARRPDEQAAVFRTSAALLRHLQLFFIPVGVGVVVYLSTLTSHALPLTVALVGSWLIGLLVVGGLMQWWITRTGSEGQS